MRTLLCGSTIIAENSTIWERAVLNYGGKLLLWESTVLLSRTVLWGRTVLLGMEGGRGSPLRTLVCGSTIIAENSTIWERAVLNSGGKQLLWGRTVLLEGGGSSHLRTRVVGVDFFGGVQSWGRPVLNYGREQS